MNTVKEITVFLENQTGTLAKVTHALGEQGIGILGFDLSNALDYGALRIVVDAPDTALHLFGEHNMFALEHDVLMIALRHETGAMTRMCRALAGAGIGIDYAYGSAGPSTGQQTTMFLRVADPARAAEVLAGVDGVS